MPIDPLEESSSGKEGGFFTRRILLVIGWVGFLVSLVGPAVANVRFLFPNVVYEPPTLFKVGKPEDFPPESATFIAEHKVFISHESQGFRAISAVCTHLRCTINPFVDPDDRYPVRYARCPCHGSVFDINGNVLDGPAPRPLDFFAVRLAPDGRLQVDAGRQVAHDDYFKA